jgi:hypothetical protein
MTTLNTWLICCLTLSQADRIQQLYLEAERVRLQSGQPDCTQPHVTPHHCLCFTTRVNPSILTTVRICSVTLSQADRIQQLYPEAERVRLQSGHCPHDDTPEEANAALLEWLDRVYKH